MTRIEENLDNEIFAYPQHSDASRIPALSCIALENYSRYEVGDAASSNRSHSRPGFPALPSTV